MKKIVILTSAVAVIVVLVIVFISLKNKKELSVNTTDYTYKMAGRKLEIINNILNGTIYYKSHSIHYMFFAHGNHIQMYLSPALSAKTNSKDEIPQVVVREISKVLQEQSEESNIGFIAVPDGSGSIATNSLVLKDKKTIDLTSTLALINKIQKKTGFNITVGGDSNLEMVTITNNGSLCKTLHMSSLEADIFAKKYGYKKIGKKVIVHPGQRFHSKNNVWAPIDIEG